MASVNASASLLMSIARSTWPGLSTAAAEKSGVTSMIFDQLHSFNALATLRSARLAEE
jgi:hypothetical protein